MRKPVGRVRIHDVARRAGVSITAVSFALNGKGSLSDETRARIIAVADELNYRANALARGLRHGSVGVIGFVIRPLDAMGQYGVEGVDVFTRTASAAAAAALDRGLGLVLLPDLSKPPLPPLALSLDGYIVMNPVEDDPVVELLSAHRIPFVTLGRDPSRRDAVNWVAHDDAEGTRIVLDEMQANGARRIVYLGGSARDAWNIDTEIAYRRWMGERDLEPRVLRVPESAGEQGAHELVPRMLEEGAVDAVFCLTGRQASGVMSGLRAAGLRSPEDVLIAAGSDAGQARLASPPISALARATETLGAELVAMLDALLHGVPPHTPLHVPTIYHSRASTLRTRRS